MVGYLDALGIKGKTNNIATGGYPKFLSQGLHENYLPIWL